MKAPAFLLLFVTHSSVVVFGCLSEHNLRAVRLPEVTQNRTKCWLYHFIHHMKFSLKSITIIITIIIAIITVSYLIQTSSRFNNLLEKKGQ